jgi:PTH1 family peptidyl-tRNA hydrolase
VKVVVGLGNPGTEYARTRHNVGFAVVDELADRLGCAVRRSFRFSAAMGKAAAGGETVLFVKPRTYMNRSGEAVAPILRFWKVAPPDLIVVLDDADLELGRLRVRAKGSSGGHRGLESVLQCVGSDAFTRVRLGIGRRVEGRDLVEHVLTAFSREELDRMAPAIKAAADAVLCVVESGVEAAMNRFNAPAQAEAAPRAGERRTQQGDMG